MTPFRKPWDDPEIRAFLNRPGGSPLTLMKQIGDRARTAPISPPVISPEPEPQDELAAALGSFDRHQASKAQEPAQQSGPRDPKAAPEVDASTGKGNYYDEELPPILKPKEQEPPKEYEPDKGWRAIDAIASAFGGREYDARYWQSVDDRGRAQHKEAANKQTLEQLQNPASQASRTAQNKWRQYLNAAGYSDQEVNRMSAKDMEGFDLADVSKFAHTAVQKRDEMVAREKAERAALQEKRGYDEGRDQVRTAAEQAEFDRRNGITSQQQDRRTSIMAGNRRSMADYESELAEGRKIAGEERERGAKRASEVQQLNRALALMDGRDDSQRLPNQGHAIDQAGIVIRQKLEGGSGMSDEDTRLDNALVGAGLSSFTNTANNAPNSEPERTFASATYRGNGTVGSARAAIQARLRELEGAESTIRNQSTSAGSGSGSQGTRPQPSAPPRVQSQGGTIRAVVRDRNGKPLGKREWTQEQLEVMGHPESGYQVELEQ